MPWVQFGIFSSFPKMPILWQSGDCDFDSLGARRIGSLVFFLSSQVLWLLASYRLISSREGDDFKDIDACNCIYIIPADDLNACSGTFVKI